MKILVLALMLVMTLGGTDWERVWLTILRTVSFLSFTRRKRS